MTAKELDQRILDTIAVLDLDNEQAWAVTTLALLMYAEGLKAGEQRTERKAA